MNTQRHFDIAITPVAGGMFTVHGMQDGVELWRFNVTPRGLLALRGLIDHRISSLSDCSSFAANAGISIPVFFASES